MSGFCGFRLRLTAAGLGFAVTVGADYDFALCPVDDFGLAVIDDFVMLAFLCLINLQICRLRDFHFR